MSGVMISPLSSDEEGRETGGEVVFEAGDGRGAFDILDGKCAFDTLVERGVVDERGVGERGVDVDERGVDEREDGLAKG